ncbi:KipI family sensor histidine kinase inhibitor [Tamilnaduibacter salinus]|uniref:KipI family sensor histidine kinase inhibitor n=1 Tax=Tamilnaduibacter salinus TaxID=1484056 RepID=A0A2U1CUH5_9GAMM|nr:5-oxoprolinase subunit PxpB [Tamilnaduibacter salinus]PVY70664.1 KipI family sensor histidine kinase inhibitor [Tamilnaduibacter salinus]
MTTPCIENAGVDAWMVRFADQINPDNQRWIRAFCRQCRAVFGPALVDLVPSYTTVLVQYDPWQMTDVAARATLSDLLDQLAPESAETVGRLVELPVWYDVSVGPELALIAEQTGWTMEQVASAHAAGEYQVFALGFVPGFAFMGLVDPALATPRLATPRQRVPKGSIAIAERQTSAYPQVTPGGWNLIGRTPLTLFDPQSDPMTVLEAGDRVRFVPITRDCFIELGGDTTPVGEGSA